jgi:hypothetical protein
VYRSKFNGDKDSMLYGRPSCLRHVVLTLVKTPCVHPASARHESGMTARHVTKRYTTIVRGPVYRLALLGGQREINLC